MISLKEFKKSLGSKVEKMTDTQIEVLRDGLEGVADIIFDSWLEKINNTRYVSDKRDNVTQHEYDD